jgi:tetratricopeptide (TPR) repeat protein
MPVLRSGHPACTSAPTTSTRDGARDRRYPRPVASKTRARPLALALTLALGSACGNETPPAQPEPATPIEAAPAVAVDNADPHYLRALELEAAGRFVEARTEIDLALAASPGRDASLLAAKLAILRDDLDAAQRLLEPLASDPNDALVLYNLGLVAQRRGQYNNARTRYLAALKADPGYAASRYNLAILTWDAGAKQEAQHHAQKFLEQSPQDPRASELRRHVGLEAAPAGPTVDTSPAAAPATATKSPDLIDPFARR